MTTSEAQKRPGTFFRYGLLTAVLGLSLGIGGISVYSRHLDDYYSRRMGWEEEELNRYDRLPPQLKRELLQQQESFDQQGLEEWMLVIAGGVAALVAAGGFLPFFLNYSERERAAT